MVTRVGWKAKELEERHERHDECARHRRAGQQPGRLPAEQTDPHQAVDGGAETGEERDEPDQIHKET